MKVFPELSSAGAQRAVYARSRAERWLRYGLLAIWLTLPPAHAEDFPNASTRSLEVLVSQALRDNPEIAAA